MLKIHLLGKLDIFCGEEHITGLDTQKVEELLCYLLVNRSRTLSRDSVADLLWGDINPEQAKNYLRKCLWQLQSCLDRHMKVNNERLIIADSDWVQINPESDLWLDIANLEVAYSGVQGKNGRELIKDQAETLKRTLELYRGDLLEGWYQDWCIFERERFQYIFIALMDKLMDFYVAQGEPELGLPYGNIILRYDRARERTHQRMMLLYYQAGERAAALRQYEKCASALKEELDVEPSKRTLQLYEQIRTDTVVNLGSVMQLNQQISSSYDEFDLLVNVPSNLLHIKQLLINIQTKLENELNVIQRAINSKQ